MSNIVVFGLGEQKYGIPIEQVREIMPCMQVTPVPGTPACFEGFLNVRGELISLVNLRLFIGMEGLKDLEDARILIICSQEGNVQGMLVDEVTSITEISWDDLQPMEEKTVGKGFAKDLLKGVVETPHGLVVILDVEEIMSGEKTVARETVLEL